MPAGPAACAEVEIVPLMLAERGERAKVQNELWTGSAMTRRQRFESYARLVSGHHHPWPPLCKGGKGLRGSTVVGRPMTSQMGSDDGALCARLER